MTNIIEADIGWEHPDDPGEPQTGVRRLSVSAEEALILAELATDKRVVELGTGLGVSTRALATHAKFVVTIDIDDWVEDEIVPALLDDLDNVLFLRGRALLEKWKRSDGKSPFADLVFIDADHRTREVESDIRWARQNLAAGGTIVLHDSKSMNVRSAITCDARFYDTEHGLAVIST